MTQLRGENADQSHVVLVGDRTAATRPCNQEADLLGIEVSVAPDFLFTQQVIHIWRGDSPEKKAGMSGAR